MKIQHACVSEEILNGYLTGSLGAEKKPEVEKHLADCPYCIYRIAEAYEVLNENRLNFPNILKKIKEFFMNTKNKVNYWLFGSIVMFVLSFVVKQYFVQFLAAAIILALKWIVDSKNAKMLIMIYDAWKKGGRKEAGRILESLDSRMKK